MSDVETAQAADTGAEQPNVPAQDVEAKARQYGWRPKEDWKGDDSRWVDAGEFVRRGEEVLPIVKATNAKLEKALDDANAKISEMENAFRDFSQHHTKTQERAYKAAFADLERRQAEAVEANDLAGVRQVTKEIAELSSEIAAPGQSAGRDDQKLVSEFQKNNPWYGGDEDLTAYANGLKLPSSMPTEEQLRTIAAKVKAAFPHKFENPNRSAPAAVEGGGQPPKKAGKGWADVPPEAKAFAERMVKQGLISKEQYAKDYFA